MDKRFLVLCPHCDKEFKIDDEVIYITDIDYNIKVICPYCEWVEIKEIYR